MSSIHRKPLPRYGAMKGALARGLLRFGKHRGVSSSCRRGVEAGRQELSLRETLVLLCEREIARKDERRIEMTLKLARFPFVRDLAGFDFAAQPSIDPKQVRELAGAR